MTPERETPPLDLEEAHIQLVKRIHAVKRIPRVVEAQETFEKETLIDPVSSDEDFFMEHLNKSLQVDSCPGIKKNEFSMDENPNLVAIATYE